MANEITINISGTLSNGSLADTFSDSDQITQTTQGASQGVVSVTTSEADLSLGSVASGLIILKNLDATNYVKYGPKSGGAMIEFGRLEPGQVNLVRLPSGVTLRWIANSATCKVLFKAWET